VHGRAGKPQASKPTKVARLLAESGENTTLQDQCLREALRREVTQLLRLVALFVVVFMALKLFVVEGFEVEGNSMQPTLRDQERILVFKLPQEVARFFPFLGVAPVGPDDVVVFDSSVEPGKRYVKRCIVSGVPRTARNTVSASEHGALPARAVVVQVKSGKVFATNLPAEAGAALEALHPEESYDDVTLEPGDLYVLGDHRSVSRDSRSFGPVRADQVVGRAVLRFWPLDRFAFL